jgi:Uma2 family endonuclease
MSVTAEIMERRHRITLAEYHRMGEADVFGPDPRLELIEGEIVDMAPIGSRHAGIVNFLNDRLQRAAGGRAIAAIQNPLVLGEGTEVQPDVALLRPRIDFYRFRHPQAADAFLVIEVADQTLRYDRDVKVALYAAAGVPEVWLVDLNTPALTVFRGLSGGRYDDVATIIDPARLTLAALPDVTIDLAGLFGG